MNTGTARDLRLHALVSLALLAAIALWDAAGLDVAAARLFGSQAGFALKDHWFTTRVLHDGGRLAAGAALAWMLVGTAFPTGVLRRLERRERIALLLTTAAALLLVPAIKHYSLTSCPWDLREFGGVAAHVSHWRLGVRDGGPGHCFPAGHASAAFAFLAGYFFLKPHGARVARHWLLAVLAAGLVTGLAQQARGAHYLSHTLWTAWFCWAAGFAGQAVTSLWQARRGAGA